MLLEDSAVIYTNKEETKLYYAVKDENPQTVIDVNGNEHIIDQKNGVLTIYSSGTIEIKRKDSKKIFFWR